MTPTALLVRCSSLSVSRRDQRLVHPWLQKLIDICSWTVSENLFTQWQDLFPVLLFTNLLVRGHSCGFSHNVSSENPRGVSDRPRQHRRMCCHFNRLDFCLQELPDMFWQVHALWRRLSQLLQCSDGSVSVTLVVEFASVVIQDDIFPLCPVATEELLLCLHVDKSVHTPGHAPIWLLPQQHGACASSWSRAPYAICRGPPSPMYPRSN